MIGHAYIHGLMEDIIDKELPEVSDHGRDIVGAGRVLEDIRLQ